MSDQKTELDVYLENYIAKGIARNEQDPVRVEGFEAALRLLDNWVPQNPLYCGHVTLPGQVPSVYSVEHQEGQVKVTWESPEHLQEIQEARRNINAELTP